MNVLIACEESQTVCKAFRELGHNAFSCDIIDCSGGHPEWHIKGDCLEVINGAGKTKGLISLFETQDGSRYECPEKWDLVIAHPPCTYLSKCGARFLYPTAGNLDLERYKKGLEAKEFFLKCLNCNCDKVCVENPVSLKVFEMPECTQEIQPYQFGHPYSKKTRLWLKGLPPLKPTNILDKFTPFLPSNTGGFARGEGGSRGTSRNAKQSSKTFEGIAKAMAQQWGGKNEN